MPLRKPTIRDTRAYQMGMIPKRTHRVKVVRPVVVQKPVRASKTWVW